MKHLGRKARAASRTGAIAACAAFAAANGCRGARADEPTGAGADLQRDLDAAAASAAFAPPIGAGRGEAPARFVSALELGASPDSAGPARTTAPRGHSAPRARRSAPPAVTLVHARHRSTATIAGEEVADASPVTAESGTTADVASAGSGTYTAPIETAPTPGAGSGAGAGSGRGRGAGRPGGGWNVVGAVLGTAIGVVIRGGGVGEDHCDIHARRSTTNPRNDPRSRRPVWVPAGGVPVGSAGGFVGVSISNPPHVVVEGPSDRPMGAPPRAAGVHGAL